MCKRKDFILLHYDFSVVKSFLRTHRNKIAIIVACIAMAIAALALTGVFLANAMAVKQNKTELQKNKSDKENLKNQKEKLEKEIIPNLQKDRDDWKTKAESKQKAKEEAQRLASQQVRIASVSTIKTSQSASSQGLEGNNEAIVWEFLIKHGFSRNQTAGIMGNLQQEHSFQTSGDGLAQWMGGRKSRLMAMNDPYSLQTQLEFLLIELNEGCGGSIRATDDLVSATLIFQNQFERCGNCMQNNRINYAWGILARH